MKKSKRQKGTILIFLFISIIVTSSLNIPLNPRNKVFRDLTEKNHEVLNAGTKTEEISTIFTWKSNYTNFKESSLESFNLDSFVGNLTDFDPINSTSYTNTDTLDVTYQASNASWSHFRDFDDNAELPSTNNVDMLNPYDTTVFFAREGAIYNLTTSWEGFIILGQLETYFFLFNQSQFHNFESYIQPWRTLITSTIAGFKSAHNSSDWLIDYSNDITGSGTLNDTQHFEVTFNKTGWYYLVMWGPESTETPKVKTVGELLSDGTASVLISANNLMDIYRPSLGRVVGTITKPNKTYERIIRGSDVIYGHSLVLIYIYEFSNRQIQNTLTWSEYDWAPYIVYIDPDSVGKFPNRIVYFHDDSWADFQDRYVKIIDPNSSLGQGTHSFKVNITAQFAPFLNETVRMNATISKESIEMKNRLGASVRLATTTNSHGFEIKPYNNATGITYEWDEIPRFSLDNSTLRDLYNRTIIEFLEAGWQEWSAINLWYPEKTPFTLYFNSLFESPYIVSGLENLLLVAPKVQTWLSTIDPNNLYFNSTLDLEINTTVDIPVNFTLTYPDNEPAVGEFCDITLEIGDMGNPNITIDYRFNYSMDINVLIFSNRSYNIFKNGTIKFEIPLQEIEYLLPFIGVEDGLSGLASRKFQEQIDKVLEESELDDYIAIENFLLGSHVVGNIVSCDITVHLWPIIKDVIQEYKPDWYIACLLLDAIVLHNETGLDLILSPQLQGVISGEIVGDGLDFENRGNFEFNDTQKSIIFHTNRTQDFASTFIQLQSLLYYLNFHIDWAFEVNFNDLMHFFNASDLHWDLGTFPSENFEQNPMDNSELLLLDWGDWSSIVPNPPVLTVLTPSPTTNLVISIEWTPSLGADNYTLYRYTSPITSSNLHLTTNVKTITETSTTDTVPGIGRWYYAVIATNESGSSIPSNYEFIDVQEESKNGGSGTIPGYPLYIVGIICVSMVLILYKRTRHLKIKS